MSNRVYSIKVTKKVGLVKKPTPPVDNLPSSVDLRTSPNMPPVYDQLQLSSCTALAFSPLVKSSILKD